ncbi:MAG TPA: efflux RND transporter periplasmic adaptor subunit [Candidatus Omnitrophota bacterium]|nr:efflux RND transporter periplasmic adaptor subunit [Candidatus Omnitrophota bacterium]HPD84283.1 efflux RND transporter periplasmic adaptor subunit [Candidatus Omnitrophota bacterium]HRZ03140.1 efflux RND transporter periplasmic adaptor subunit [Candidatus Omnitrophota bacterium]
MKIYKSKLLIITAMIFVGAVFVFLDYGRPKDHSAVSQSKITYYCPMHPTYTSDKPGDCPICGMKLVKAESSSSDKTSNQKTNMPAQSKEKTLAEVCAIHKCTMRNCPMVKANIKPGERLICPVCGEVIATVNGKVVEIPREGAVSNEAIPATEIKKERKLLYYRNPMNPEATSPVPMKDSMGMDYVPIYEEASSAVASAGPSVTISPERQQMIGVKTAMVRIRDLTKVVRVSGKIAYDPELAVTQEEFIQALNVQDNIKDSPLQEVIDRAKNLTDAARNKLKLLGMNDDQISVLEQTRKAENGLYLPSKGESVWAYINVYEYEIGFIKVGDSVDLETVAYPGEKFIGKIVSISPVLDPSTRTNQVRVEVPNPDNKLKPEMFVNALIKESLGFKLAVPEAAVLDTGLRKIVYLSQENNVLESREVTLGQKAEDYYEVINGLKEGDVVVTSGNFLVDSESKLKSPS